jgi:hypothetical protein
VPASANLIQTWWRMKVAFDIPTENVNRLISVLQVFKPVLDIEELSSKLSKETKFRNGILDCQNEFNKEDESQVLLSPEQKNLDFLLKLNPKVLLLIRTILVLKYFSGRNKFKTAHKPYDFKETLDQVRVK